MSLARNAAGLAIAGVVGSVVACGPSFQVIYEGNARFEHCYAMEETPSATMSEKADCWRDWSDHYTYGQTRDRIQYAISRYVALSQAPNVPTDEALMMAAPGGTPRVSTITAPAPTSPYEPPPKVLEADGGLGGGQMGQANVDTGTSPMRYAAPPAEALPGDVARPGNGAAAPGGHPQSLPASACAERCAETYRACDASCAASRASDAGARSDRCATCGKAYRACMRGCFRAPMP